MDIRELQAKRAEAVKAARALKDKADKEKRALTAEERRQVEEHLAEAKRLKERIDEEERLDAEERAALGFPPRSGPIRPDPNDGGPSWGARRSSEPPLTIRTVDGREVRCLRSHERLADLEEVRAASRVQGIPRDELDLGRYVRGALLGDWRGAEAERRLAGDVGPSGGVFVPGPLSLNVIDLARSQAAVFRAGALTLPMTSSSLKVAVVSKDPKAHWRSENTLIPVDTDAAFEGRNLFAHTVASRVPISRELVADASNLSQVVERMLSEALSLEIDAKMLDGDGVGKPLGIRQWSSLNKDWGAQLIDMGANGGPLVRYETWADAYGKLLSVNVPGPDGLAVVMSSREAGALEKFKDSTNQPLQPPPFWSRLRRIATNQIPVDMVKGSSNDASYSIVGDFSSCLVGMRMAIDVELLREATDASTGFGPHSLTFFMIAHARMDMVLGRPNHFVIVDGITPQA